MIQASILLYQYMDIIYTYTKMFVKIQFSRNALLYTSRNIDWFMTQIIKTLNLYSFATRGFCKTLCIPKTKLG